jgi:multiple sugar transport system ATP-binding protein
VTEALGSERLVHFQLDAKPVLTDAVLELAGDLDATAADELRSGGREHRTTVIASFAGHSRVRAGDPIEARLPDALYFFNLESGQAIYA